MQKRVNLKSEELEDVVVQLEKASKLREEFATMISHELKTPLTPIKGFCKILKDQKVGQMNKKQLDYVKEILQNTDQLEELIDNLMSMKKLDMGKMDFEQTEIQTRDLLKKIHEGWEIIMAEKNIEFLTNGDGNACVICDENKLRQVFANLIKNAVDFVSQDHGKIEIGAINDEKFVTFYVKDNGIGISSANQEELFKKFYQIDATATRSHGGTGLGLAICKGLVEGMKGTIWIESKEEIGTTVFFKLPRCTEEKAN